jgi:siroheme synthase (precorrin-2 oxidase/ferrochelatase)
MERQDAILYDKVIAITSNYLGPAANRFIDRQIEGHLKKTTKELSAKDVLSLLDWIQAAVALLTEDNGIVEEYVSRLRQLAEDNSKKPGKNR